MKAFHEQFRICLDFGFNRIEKVPMTPEMIPFCPAKAKLFKDVKTIELYECLRFGGRCSSGNEGCQKLRGIK